MREDSQTLLAPPPLSEDTREGEQIMFAKTTRKMAMKAASDLYRDKHDELSWTAQWAVDNPEVVSRRSAAKQGWYLNNPEKIAKRNEKIE